MQAQGKNLISNCPLPLSPLVYGAIALFIQYKRSPHTLTLTLLHRARRLGHKVTRMRVYMSRAFKFVTASAAAETSKKPFEIQEKRGQDVDRSMIR